LSFSFLHTLKINLEKYSGRNAFYIGDRFYTFREFEEQIRKIYDLLCSGISTRQNCIGIIAEDNLETYASVMAVWFSGNIFVPLNPGNPDSRNQEIIEQAGIKTILISRGSIPEYIKSQEIPCLQTGSLPATGISLPEPVVSGPELRYLLFTSGSTGVPKGVPISSVNLDSFIDSFISAGYQFSHKDRFMQIYDLSFDASVHCYTVPLSVGACVYTVPGNSIKYLYAYKLMKDQQLTFVKMPPSTLSYLQPYFKEIRLEQLRYCLLGGEALYHELVENWAPCVPNAIIQNVYGPTEATINCTIFNWTSNLDPAKTFNGIITIGKTFGDTIAIVCDREDTEVPEGKQGELCLAGSQITQAYWNAPERDKLAFFMNDIKGKTERFYRTGDLVIRDKDGDLIYCGRIDEQVQIQGYRVELSEIEIHARQFLADSNAVAVALQASDHTMHIHLFVENCPDKIEGLKKHLFDRLPLYMLPASITNIDHFPKSTGGKIDKSALKNLIPG